MNITLMAQKRKTELLIQFCIAYRGILARHELSATSATGKLIAEATGLAVHPYLSHNQGGPQQVSARITYNEVDLLLYFTDPTSPSDETLDRELLDLLRLCDHYSVPVATNLATAEMLILGLDRGDLDWRTLMHDRKRS